jgi:hypothetical protein
VRDPLERSADAIFTATGGEKQDQRDRRNRCASRRRQHSPLRPRHRPTLTGRPTSTSASSSPVANSRNRPHPTDSRGRTCPPATAVIRSLERKLRPADPSVGVLHTRARLTRAATCGPRGRRRRPTAA